MIPVPIATLATALRTTPAQLTDPKSHHEQCVRGLAALILSVLGASSPAIARALGYAGKSGAQAAIIAGRRWATAPRYYAILIRACDALDISPPQDIQPPRGVAAEPVLSLLDIARRLGVNPDTVRYARRRGWLSQRCRLHGLHAFAQSRLGALLLQHAEPGDSLIAAFRTTAAHRLGGRWYGTPQLLDHYCVGKTALKYWRDRGWPEGYTWERYQGNFFLWAEELPLPPLDGRHADSETDHIAERLAAAIEAHGSYGQERKALGLSSNAAYRRVQRWRERKERAFRDEEPAR